MINKKYTLKILKIKKSNKIEDPKVVERVNWYLSRIEGNIGAYSESRGLKFVRESIVKYIANRDNLKAPHVDDIMLTNGASEGV